MQEHTEQQLDKLARKVVKHSELERPSLDFTTNVMRAVNASNRSHVTMYKPLISKRGWLVISMLFVGAIFYFFYYDSAQDMSWLGQIDFSLLSDNRITEVLGSVTFSKVLMYAIALFGLLWCIQISLIKNFLDRHLKY